METVAERPPPPPAAVLAAVQALSPTVAARGAEIEAARRLPADLLAALTAAGCFRLLLPPSHGGAGASLPEAMRVEETLSRADASTGWTVTLGAGAWCDLAGLPRETFDALYAGGPDTAIAGVFAPSGTAERVSGGYRVRGRWAFATGCEHSAWIYANCVEAGAPETAGAAGAADAPGASGPPPLRTVLFATDEVRIEDTWRVAGLCGTGSHHFATGPEGVVVPAARTFKTLEAEPCVETPLLRIPPPALYALQIAAVATGIAGGALDDVLAAAPAGVPLFAAAPLASNPLFQHQLAAADTRLRAARALLYAAAADAWGTALAGAPFTPHQRAEIRAAAVWATACAAATVRTAYLAAGGAALYLDNPLQRRLRDVHAVTQHFLVRADTLTTAGAVFAGQEVDLTIF
jgi:alkylation response protein AidB-like acyl-CoA dehydrogenase